MLYLPDGKKVCERRFCAAEPMKRAAYLARHTALKCEVPEGTPALNIAIDGDGPLSDGAASSLDQTTRVRRTRFGGLPCACVDEDAYATLATVYERGAACSCEACPVRRLLGSNEEEAIYEEEHASNGRKEERALPTRGGSGDELFRVVGYVDAVSPENDDSIVIEVKNRMHQVRAPELYDKLQVVTYLQMLGWSRGDLVQRVKDAPDAPVRVDRILRSDHSEDWARVVLPRLRAVAEAVLSLRADDSRRREEEGGRAEGGRAESGGEAVLTTATYPNHASFATGALPVTHGILTNDVWDGSGFVGAETLGPRCETLFAAARAAGVSSTAVLGDQKLVGVMGAAGADSHWPPRGVLPEGTQLDEFRECFDAFDKDGGGSIDSTELKKLLSSVGTTPTDEEVEESIAAVDFQRRTKCSRKTHSASQRQNL